MSVPGFGDELRSFGEAVYSKVDQPEFERIVSLAQTREQELMEANKR